MLLKHTACLVGYLHPGNNSYIAGMHHNTESEQPAANQPLCRNNDLQSQAQLLKSFYNYHTC